MAPNMLWFEKNGARIDMKSCFLEVIFIWFFSGTLGELGKIPSHPQKFVCSYTFEWK